MDWYTSIINITKKQIISNQGDEKFKTNDNFNYIHELMHQFRWNKDDCIVYSNHYELNDVKFIIEWCGIDRFIHKHMINYNLFIYHPVSNKMYSISTGHLGYKFNFDNYPTFDDYEHIILNDVGHLNNNCKHVPIWSNNKCSICEDNEIKIDNNVFDTKINIMKNIKLFTHLSGGNSDSLISKILCIYNPEQNENYYLQDDIFNKVNELDKYNFKDSVPKSFKTNEFADKLMEIISQKYNELLDKSEQGEHSDDSDEDHL